MHRSAAQEVPDTRDWVAVWNYFQPRSAHSWNSFVMAVRRLEGYSYDECNDTGLEAEFLWHDVILRLWLFRQCHRALELFPPIGPAARDMTERFDGAFLRTGASMLELARDALECVAESAMHPGRATPGAGGREAITRTQFRKGDIALDLETCKAAAAEMLETAKVLGASLDRHFEEQGGEGERIR